MLFDPHGPPVASSKLYADYPWLFKVVELKKKNKIRHHMSTPTRLSATMECRHKHNLVPSLQLVRVLALKLPVGVVDED
jgi:hypothetical protein